VLCAAFDGLDCRLRKGNGLPDDPELLRRTATGDRESFAGFVRRHEASVCRYTRALTD
jgi:hypothetical protein